MATFNQLELEVTAAAGNTNLIAQNDDSDWVYVGNWKHFLQTPLLERIAKWILQQSLF